MANNITKRTNTAKWIEKERRWKIYVQRDGKRRTFYSSTPGRNGQREANAKADDWLMSGGDKDSPTVDTVIADYLANVLVVSGKESYRKAEVYSRLYISPAIGKTPIVGVTPQRYQDILNAASIRGVSGKPLSKNSLLALKGTEIGLAGFAMKSGYVASRVDDLEIPRVTATTRKGVLQPDTVKTLFTDATTVLRGSVCDEWFINLFRFMVVTGLRKGEAIGVAWDDINDGILHVSRSVGRGRDISQGKNQNARRVIALPSVALGILSRQREMLHSCGINSNFVFPDKIGACASPNTVSSRWRTYLSHHGIPHIPVYNLRHTFVSMLIGHVSGEELKRVVGHSALMDTFGVYGREIDGQAAITAAKIDARYGAIFGDENVSEN